MAGLILAGIGFLMAFVIGGTSMQLGEASTNWPTVEGVIKSAQIGDTGRPAREGDSRSYHPEIRYEYLVDGETFTSERISFRLEGIQSHARPEIAEIVASYRPGSKVTVHYNPEDPSVSCLETGMNVGGLVLIGMVCMAIGLLVVLSGTVAAIRHGISPASEA